MDSVDMLIYHPEDYESTKGHSVLRNRWGYGGRAMSPVDDLYLSDIYRPRYSTYYDTTGTENEIRRNVNRELLFSTHAADDAFDMAAKSKNRDQEILREAYNAIGIKDRLSSGYSALSEALRLPRYRRRLPLALEYEDDEDLYGYDYSSPLLSRRKRIGDYSYGQERLNLFPLHGSRHRALPSSDASLDQIDSMEMYDPDAELQLTTLEKIKIKAALVGSKVDVVTPKSRRPKSDYAAKVIRRIKKEEREQTAPEDVTCSSMSASKPVSFTPDTKFHGDNEYSPMSDVRRRVRSVIRKNKRAASVI